MMQQKIVADPQAKPLLSDATLNDVCALIETARHTRTLVDAVSSHVDILLRAAKSSASFYETSEWSQINDFLIMIKEKADHVEDVAERVEASEWHSWALSAR